MSIIIFILESGKGTSGVSNVTEKCAIQFIVIEVAHIAEANF